MAIKHKNWYSFESFIVCKFITSFKILTPLLCKMSKLYHDKRETQANIPLQT
jgi:hypothetical protein